MFETHCWLWLAHVPHARGATLMIITFLLILLVSPTILTNLFAIFSTYLRFVCLFVCLFVWCCYFDVNLILTLTITLKDLVLLRKFNFESSSFGLNPTCKSTNLQGATFLIFRPGVGVLECCRQLAVHSTLPELFSFSLVLTPRSS